MKKETYAAKLLELLGDVVTVPDHIREQLNMAKENKTKSKVNQYVAVPEQSIQNFRAAQGVIYFLQAPEVFKLNKCKHCKEQFLVSRKFVGYCSYTCIKVSLNEMGFEWRKGENIEALVADPNVYNKNEPIWIKNLDKIKKILEEIE